MATAFTAGFLGSIKRVLVDASTGIASSHHVHNVQAGIANILSLLQYDDEIEAAAARLNQTAANYLNRHGIASTTTIEQERCADIDRFGAAQDSLAAFRAALERGQPNSRVRTLGLR